MLNSPTKKICTHSEKFYVIIIILVSLLSVSFAKDFDDNRQSDRKTSFTQSCGANCLSIAMLLLGRDVSAEKCIELADVDPGTGRTSLAKLLRAVKSLGQDAVGMNLSPQELALINKPAILHVFPPPGERHFVVFSKMNGRSFELLEISADVGPQKQVYTADQLELLWDGDCLVLSDKRLYSTFIIFAWRCRYAFAVLIGVFAGTAVWRVMKKRVCGFVSNGLVLRLATGFAVVTLCLIAIVVGPTITKNSKSDLVVGAHAINVGELEWSKGWRGPVCWLKNNGHKPLHIDSTSIKRSCTCILAHSSQSIIEPGKEAYLELHIRGQRKAGSFEHSVWLPANGEYYECNRLTVQGHVVGHTVTYPPQVLFEACTTGHKRRIVCLVRKPNIAIYDVHSDLPFLSCTSRPCELGYEIEVALTEVPEQEKFEGNVIIVISDDDPSFRELKIPVYGIACN